MNELNAALYSQLVGGTALVAALGGTAIYNAQAPNGASLPYVVFSHQAGGELNITPSPIHDVVYYVRAYAATAKQAAQINALIRARLHNQPITVTGWTVVTIQREDIYTSIETDAAGVQTHAAGGMYRIQLDQ